MIKISISWSPILVEQTQLEGIGVTTGILTDRINLISFQKNKHETRSGPGTLETL